MKLYDWLSKVDTIGIFCNIWLDDETCEEPIFAGSMYDIPYWLADYELIDETSDGDKAIYYAHKIHRPANCTFPLDQEYNGFVITVKEKYN